ncbi:MAG: TIGR04086 family membrane protein [Ruminococcaceae bacterium]|nr:TIGR04086 family membrane protein [Oscillospiraceae bacterium]
MSDYKTKIKLNRMRREASQSRSRGFYIIRGVLISLCITIPVIFATAGASYITEFPEEYISPIVFTSIILSIFLSSFLSSAWQKNCGWSNGTLIGGIYMFCIVILRSILENRICIDKDSITMLLFGMLLGSLSGYAGLKFIRISKK